MNTFCQLADMIIHSPDNSDTFSNLQPRKLSEVFCISLYGMIGFWAKSFENPDSSKAKQFSRSQSLCLLSIVLHWYMRALVSREKEYDYMVEAIVASSKLHRKQNFFEILRCSKIIWNTLFLRSFMSLYAIQCMVFIFKYIFETNENDFVNINLIKIQPW